MAIKIFIDQGHNPVNPNAGAEGNGLREQDITYEIGRLTAELLRQNSNFDVLLSRPTPDTVLGTTNAQSLAARVNAANNWGADYFISLHANASSIPTATGTEAYVYTLDSEAAPFARYILAGISAYTGIPDRGVFARPTLYVLRRTQMPATLVELGFITTYSEAMLMANSPELFAQGIYQGLLNYFGLS